ncbi:type II secretion system protein [Desulfonatronum thioautotrophicum]|uniref:type II secretion system protein n=1 Tax=Desulfonatronum thioautotrophicum TaxID=617001 RepID=UPI0005EB0FC2|nr:type II secretion system protein [Desulfonatronum thioautotrophicum]
MSRKSGFTLLEVLIVIAIMGLIAAMVAPRFAGLRGESEVVIRDTNQGRMASAITGYWESFERYPSGLTNLLDENNATGVGPFDGINRFRMPTNTSQLEVFDRGTATFDESFIARLKPEVHVLNAAEAFALRQLGVTTVVNLNAYNFDGLSAGSPLIIAARANPKRISNVDTGLGVLMAGIGAPEVSPTGAWEGRASTPALLQTDSDWTSPDAIGRIILGLGPDSDLIAREIISTAGLCPEGLGNQQTSWNHYVILLPRLQATVDRMTNALGEPLTAFTHLREITAESNSGNNGIERTFNLLEPQSRTRFHIYSPKGHRWQDELDRTMWRVTEVSS